MTNTTNNTSSPASSNSIIERIGGERDFGFVILSLVDRLRADKQLGRFFCNSFEANDLASHQEEFLRAVFAQAEDMNNESCKNNLHVFIHLRYFRLMKQGFSAKHFDLTVKHIVESLEDAWVDDEEVIADTVQVLKSVRPIFEQQEKPSRRRTSSTRTPVTVVPSLA